MIDAIRNNQGFSQYRMGFVQPQNQEPGEVWRNPQHGSGISASPLQKAVKAAIFYINDVHGQTPKMEMLKTAAMAFDEYVKAQGVDALKVSSGDIFIGADEATNKAAAKFLDIAGIQYMGPGNHDFDPTVTKLKNFLDGVATKLVGTNVTLPTDSVLNGQLMQSYIHSDKEGKYGIIGAQPMDLAQRVTKPEHLEGLVVADLKGTIDRLRKEVQKLEAQGVDKIILLSHSGFKADQEIAKNVSGIDVINGGHSHDLIKGIQENVNLFHTPRNEPVVITQAGRDGQQFGVLDLEFVDGIITAARNRVFKTDDYNKNLLMTYAIDSVTGEPKRIGVLKYADPFPKNPLSEENAFGNFICDAMKEELGADISILNSGNIRGSLAPGSITTRDISSISPFKNRIVKAVLTEKDVVDALKLGAKSITKSDGKPGILYTSGIRYELNKDGKLLKAEFVGKDKQATQIDVENPSTTKTYVAVYDDFYARGSEGFSSLNKMGNLLEYYHFDKDKTACDYIEKMNNKPFEIRLDGRIKIS